MTVLRAIVIYVFLLFLFRAAGQRTLSQMTSFDLVLLVIVSEAVSPALTGGDASLTGAILSATTLITLDIGIAYAKVRWARLEGWLEGRPIVIVEHGRLLEGVATKARVDLDDVLFAARATHGLERLEQIKYAVLERNGAISIIPVDEVR